MKIDKVVFSCSNMQEYYSFWYMQSKVWKLGLGIEPVLLYYGDKVKDGLSEEFGKVIEMQYIEELGSNVNSRGVVQVTMSKFFHPQTEPGKTWIIGDIDMIPLQRFHFINMIAATPDTALLHLNAGGIAGCRLGNHNGFAECGCQVTAKKYGQPGADLPGHYHVAKGSTFSAVFSAGKTFAEHVKHLIDSDLYGMGPQASGGSGAWAEGSRESNAYWWYWCAEESYTSEQIEVAMHQRGLQYIPFFYRNENNSQRIGRDGWDEATQQYLYDKQKATDKVFVDCHCARPYEKQARSYEEALALSKLLP